MSKKINPVIVFYMSRYKNGKKVIPEAWREKTIEAIKQENNK